MWVLLAALAVWWPARLNGPLDGIPLDRMVDAIVLGLVFPALLWLHTSFLDTRRARMLILGLLSFKAVTALALVQDGWCVRVDPVRPYVRDATGAPHSWDIRADWRSPNPMCSALMTRSYPRFAEFPIWFFNLPSATGGLPSPDDLPPLASTRMTVSGILTTPRSGTFTLVTTPDITAAMNVNGQAMPSTDTVTLQPGSHAVSIDAALTGRRWRFETTWNGEDVWPLGMTTMSRPSAVDLAMRPWGRWIVPGFVGALLVMWIVAAAAGLQDVRSLAWTIGASLSVGLFVAFASGSRWQWAIAALACAAALPVGNRLKNIRGAFWLVGVPWLVFVVVMSAPLIGRVFLYSAGDDFWAFQRYAYRIYMQGYWLEGGELTFWFQPLYRWIAGGLHLVFGDSSVGESYWDGACVLVMALFSFHATKAFAGAAWGVTAAALTLALFVAGPGWTFIGRGLSEISSAGFIYLAALFALRSRHGSWRMGMTAGLLALLGFYTRMNNLPMAMMVAAFAWPVQEPVRTLFRPSAWFAHVSMKTIVCVVGTLFVGLVLFALRTWHYTGVFSVFYGTQGAARRIWQPGMPVGATARAMFDSLMMVLTTADPPQFHRGSVPLLIAAVLAPLAAAGVYGLRDLPFGPVLFCLASLAGALVARGTAYPGRFSIHIIGAAATVVVCTTAMVISRARDSMTTFLRYRSCRS